MVGRLSPCLRSAASSRASSRALLTGQEQVQIAVPSADCSVVVVGWDSGGGSDLGRARVSASNGVPRRSLSVVCFSHLLTALRFILYWLSPSIRNPKLPRTPYFHQLYFHQQHDRLMYTIVLVSLICPPSLQRSLGVTRGEIKLTSSGQTSEWRAAATDT